MAKVDIVGSWFPTGFHGHVRSKPRNDFICEFRQLARPQPPKKFIARAKCKPTVHVFSTHDNKSAFLSDAVYFERGLGRRRNPNKAYSFNPSFISWVPPGQVAGDKQSVPLVSSYRLNFQNGSPGAPIPQIMIKRPATSFEGTPTTTYRYAHGTEQPHREAINAMNNEALMLTYQRQTHKPRQDGRHSVASCMTWHVPEPPKRTKLVPMATQTTDFTDIHRFPSSTCTSMSNSSTEQNTMASISWPQQTTSTCAAAESE